MTAFGLDFSCFSVPGPLNGLATHFIDAGISGADAKGIILTGQALSKQVTYRKRVTYEDSAGCGQNAVRSAGWAGANKGQIPFCALLVWRFQVLCAAEVLKKEARELQSAGNMRGNPF